jgi:hypothetical protein
MDAPGNDRGEWISGVSSKDCESICVADSGCDPALRRRLFDLARALAGGAERVAGN